MVDIKAEQSPERETLEFWMTRIIDGGFRQSHIGRGHTERGRYQEALLLLQPALVLLHLQLLLEQTLLHQVGGQRLAHPPQLQRTRLLSETAHLASQHYGQANQWASQSVSQLISEPANQWASQSVTQLVGQYGSLSSRPPSTANQTAVPTTLTVSVQGTHFMSPYVVFTSVVPYFHILSVVAIPPQAHTVITATIDLSTFF